MLRAATLAQPDRTAVSCGTERLTFRQFRQRSTTMAGHLRRLGAAPDDPVGIFMEPSVDLMVSVWGCAARRCPLPAAVAGVPGRTSPLHDRGLLDQAHRDR
ncbi:AMP-binding protein [Streptomyces sp. NPDC093084]|uniref:AMP-binding protein n=1 Tax=Streptomyces sp. NPDC093084 TaxID=3155197 RepID=UPI00342043AC